MRRALGRFDVLGRIATGGMGEILLAKAGGERFALKCLRRDLARDRRFVAMLREEARLAGDVRHANVCRVFALEEAEDGLFLVMEYLRGWPFGVVARRLGVGGIVGLGVQACAGLHAAHERGMVHRDVTPANLYVTVDGVLKVLDFGIAKAAGSVGLTEPGTLKGNVPYMAPEYLAGTQLDRRADLFSLGVVLWEALTGRPLFRRADQSETRRAVSEAEVPAADGMPAPLEKVLRRAVARLPSERPRDARRLGAELGKAVDVDRPEAIARALADDLGDVEPIETTTEELRRP